MVAFGLALGVPERVTLPQAGDLTARLRREASKLFEAVEAGEYSTALPGEAQLLRQIVHGVMKDTLDQINA